jgi:hypothetical protein
VQRVTETDFFVPFRGRPGSTSFWCAAGDFVIRGMDLGPATRVFRLSAPPRRGGALVSGPGWAATLRREEVAALRMAHHHHHHRS